MKSTDLIRHLDGRLIRGTADKNVNALVYFSEETVPESVFFAIPGTDKNGMDYAAEAAAKGAHTIITEEDRKDILPLDGAVVQVPSVRKALADASCLFYRNPSRFLFTIGVTGTKGKTSTAFMVRAILEEAGIPTGLIGTVENGWENHFQEADRTTPQSLDIQRWCRKMADAGCRAVVMEVSSQGLMQQRTEGIEFDIGIFTNLSPDHIGPGEHESFEEYMGWKGRLFGQCRRAVICEDEPRWRKLLARERKEGNGRNFPLPYEVISFGKSGTADFRMGPVKPLRGMEGPGISFSLNGHQAELGIGGTFNAANAAGAAPAARCMGLDWETILAALKKVRIPGRMEPVDTGGRTCVLVDYAHSGIALRSVLTDLRACGPDRIITVFGCGGNRDKNRRLEMGRAAAELSDLVFVTSDNPRKERPEDIIADITGAMEEASRKGAECIWQVIPDRAEAIRRAVEAGCENDIVLIAGKGHETYQLAGEEKIHFDDREVVRNMYGGNER